MMSATPQQFYVIDFDSTFTRVEALDELAKISLAKDDQQNEKAQSIVDITNKAMAGEMPFDIALAERLNILKPNKQHLQVLITELQTQVSDSFKRNADAIKFYAKNIIVVSGGFKEYIVPVVAEFGIEATQVYANTFLFDEQENVIGFDKNNPLSKPQGKVHLLQQLQLKGEVHVIGDGYTDFEIKQAGLAKAFYMFEENVSRAALAGKADYVVQSLDEFLYLNNMLRSQSFPKAMIKVLLLENVHPNAVRILQQEGFSVEVLKTALTEEELIEKIGDIHLLGIRSKTQVADKVLQHAKKLMSIGTFCIGTNQVDLQACSSKGIAVFNAPYSNTRSVVELTLGNIIMLMRNAVTKSEQLHKGIWDKSATNCFELRGKALGLVGYGNIGTQLGILAEALGMQVLFYDIADKLALGNAKRCASLKELLQHSDIVSLHVDGRTENTNLINAESIAIMKQGALLLNLSRGHIVDLEAVQHALQAKHLTGVALDVYPYEPTSNDEIFTTPLQGMPNVILTPHIGGSTEEAQANIGEFVPYKMLNYINKGDTYGSVNLPEVQLPEFNNAHRLLHIHHNVPGILAKLNAVFAKYEVNIHAQYLKTNERVGYVITDVASGYDTEIINEIRNIEGTIRFRSIYN
jgi:D-3-phosphoglycerate dehydrogenase / 2-oxoglutarate reductase